MHFKKGKYNWNDKGAWGIMCSISTNTDKFEWYARNAKTYSTRIRWCSKGRYKNLCRSSSKWPIWNGRQFLRKFCDMYRIYKSAGQWRAEQETYRYCRRLWRSTCGVGYRNNRYENKYFLALLHFSAEELLLCCECPQLNGRVNVKVLEFQSFRWPRLPLIGWDIFNFYSNTTQQNSTKPDRKQYYNVFYQVCVFQPDRKTKIAALASDWLRNFWLLC